MNKVDPLLLAFVVLVISWPVFFWLIRRHTLATGRWRGWRHLAFWLGPIFAPVIFVGLKATAKGETKVGLG